MHGPTLSLALRGYVRRLPKTLHWTVLLALASPASAQDTDLELVLLADASGSIDQAEIDFQRRGYAEAITSPDVLAAIANTAYGSIAVTYVEWAANTATVADWTLIDGPDTAQAFADTLVDTPRQAYGRNAIGSALLEGQRLIERNDIDGFRRVIDFSGDSANSYSGPAIAAARQQVIDAGITINGLAIACRDCNGQPRAGLQDAYEDQIIGGPGAFVVTVDETLSFTDAVRRKLVLEIGGTSPATRIAAVDRQPPPPDR